MRGIFFPVRTAGGAVEHVVRGHVKDASAVTSEQGGAETVGPVGVFTVVLGPVHSRIGGAVDDKVDIVFGNKVLHGRFVGDVEVGMSGIYGAIPEKETHFLPELSAGTGD